MTIAATPAPPYYAAIFTSLRTPGENGYGKMAEAMETLAATQPGFLGIESARDGLGITVSYWEARKRSQHGRRTPRTWWRSNKGARPGTKSSRCVFAGWNATTHLRASEPLCRTRLPLLEPLALAHISREAPAGPVTLPRNTGEPLPPKPTRFPTQKESP